MPDAACRDADPELFFGPHVCDDLCEGDQGCITGKSEQGRFQRIRAAKSLCGRCVEREECLDWAVATNQKFGVWGGLTERERTRLRENRRG